MGEQLNLAALGSYVRRVGERWALQRALVGGARVEDADGAPPGRERGSEYIVVLVSPGFDGLPWLERVHQAGSLWDATEMGAPADMHCYTPAEYARKLESLPSVARASERGIDLLA